MRTETDINSAGTPRAIFGIRGSRASSSSGLSPQPSDLCVTGKLAAKQSMPWLPLFPAESYAAPYLESVDSENAGEKSLSPQRAEAPWRDALNLGSSNSYSVSFVSTKTMFKEALLPVLHPHFQSHPLPSGHYGSTKVGTQLRSSLPPSQKRQPRKESEQPPATPSSSAPKAPHSLS